MGMLPAEGACGSQEDDEQEVIIFKNMANALNVYCESRQSKQKVG